jgi:histidine ammonia-lyase
LTDDRLALPMTVVLTGRDLTRAELLRVARDGEAVELDPAAIATMAASRAVVERSIERADPVYGVSTGVGVLKRVTVSGPEAAEYSRRMIRHHLVGQGPSASPELTRATMLRLANGFAGGSVGVRPILAERLVAALNNGNLPRIRTLGSVGQADLAQMADLAEGVFAEVELAAGEGLALVSSNSFATAWVALAVSDAADLLDAQETAGALSLEALAANPTMLHPAIGDVRPYPGLQRTLTRLQALLDGSFLWAGGQARNLQDPLTFRNLPQIEGACRDVLAHVDGQLAIELNASQGNPIVVPAEQRVVSVANFEILPLAVATDYLRIALASALSASAERVVKLLETPWSGLPTGLVPSAGTSEAGLSYHGIACQALAAEARLLAQPVSFEMVSTSHAEGIEDRTTMAPLAARRLAEMVELGRRIVAIELVVGAQAAELRGLEPRGRGTGRAAATVRGVVPFIGDGDLVSDVGPVVELVRAGAFGLTLMVGEASGGGSR